MANAVSNRLILLSFAFGPPTPEGLCTARLAEALTQHGVRFELWTGSSARDRGNGPPTRRFRSFSSRPARLQIQVGRAITGVPVANWDWTLRVGRARITGRPFLYARSSPAVSLLAAYRLARKRQLPFGLHFSDPIPGPWTTDPDQRNAYVRLLAPAIERAEFLTFTTDAAIRYAERAYAISISRKSRVLPNIVPEWPMGDSRSEDENGTILFVGRFYGNRTPFSLIDGIAEANRGLARPLSLRLVGTNPDGVKLCRRYAAQKIRLEVLPWTADVVSEYRRAFAAALIDADDDEPVFLSTKAGEAMQAARRVIAISPTGSPARAAFDRGLGSVVFSAGGAQQIAQNLLRLRSIDMERVGRELPVRHRLLAPFRSEAVASTLVSAFDGSI